MQSLMVMIIFRIHTFIIFRSSRQKEFSKKFVLKNFANFSGKRLCRRVFYNKVAGLQPTTVFKSRLPHKFFPVNFARYLRKSLVPASERRLSGLGIEIFLYCIIKKDKEKTIKYLLNLNRLFSFRSTEEIRDINLVI